MKIIFTFSEKNRSEPKNKDKKHEISIEKLTFFQNEIFFQKPLAFFIQMCYNGFARRGKLPHPYHYNIKNEKSKEVSRK